MNKVLQLIEGYATKTQTGWRASCSTTLIQTDKHNIIVDPGINRKLLLEQLSKNNLTTDDIDYVYLTHFHIDHVLLCAIFEKATFFDGETVYTEDLEEEYAHIIPDTDIEVIPTPGHAYEHTSLLVNTPENGKVVIAADVFWWTDDEEQNTALDALMNKADPFTKNLDELIESRKKLLQIADWIIPGHGKMFKVDRE
jgi:glyoxylase-like metal-dependent hydrolase (beta-lactamase superfamily II)